MRLEALGKRRKSRQKIIYALCFAAVITSAIVAFLFPHLRTSIALFVGAGVLLYLRSAIFAVPGINAMPFARLGKLAKSGGKQQTA